MVYKVDRLSRSLLDFARIIGIFERKSVSFVSITQQFTTTTSMGRLVLNILLSFAQSEREIIGERIRDRVAATKRRGKYTGGPPVLGYDVDRERKRLVVNPKEAELVRSTFERFIQTGSITELAKELSAQRYLTKSCTTKSGEFRAGGRWNKGHVSRLLNNPLYINLDSPQGQRLADLATRMSGLLSDEQRRACEEIVDEIREGNVGIVERATYSGEHCSIAADELPQLLTSAGFADLTYWAVPDGRAFAESLQQSGVLDRLTQDDLLPYLRALVASSPRIDCWTAQVTCRKAQ